MLVSSCGKIHSGGHACVCPFAIVQHGDKLEGLQSMVLESCLLTHTDLLGISPAFAVAFLNMMGVLEAEDFLLVSVDLPF